MTFEEYRSSVVRHLSEIFDAPVKLDWMDDWSIWFAWLAGESVYTVVDGLIEVSYIDEESV